MEISALLLQQLLMVIIVTPTKIRMAATLRTHSIYPAVTAHNVNMEQRAHAPIRTLLVRCPDVAF